MSPKKLVSIFTNSKIINPEPLVNAWRCSKQYSNSGTRLVCSQSGERRNI